jgi:hypothetical protein
MKVAIDSLEKGKKTWCSSTLDTTKYYHKTDLWDQKVFRCVRLQWKEKNNCYKSKQPINCC